MLNSDDALMHITSWNVRVKWIMWIATATKKEEGKKRIVEQWKGNHWNYYSAYDFVFNAVAWDYR